jgi:hypothetical protein
MNAVDAAKVLKSLEETTSAFHNITRVQLRMMDAANDALMLRDDLRAELMRLAEHCTRAAKRLEDPTDLPNSLGEVQRRGSEIDRLCALLCAKTEMLQVLCALEGAK